MNVVHQQRPFNAALLLMKYLLLFIALVVLALAAARATALEPLLRLA